MRKLLLIFIMTLTALCATAQSAEWTMLHQGNRAFRRGDWPSAEKYYRKALEANPRSSRAMFDLGDTYLSQKNTKEALKFFEKAAKTENNKVVKAMAYHNVGYIHHLAKEYNKAIEAYKEALRNNPRDEDTRYNLALCQKQKKDDQNQNKNQQKQQQQKQDPKSNQQPKQQPQQNQQQMSQDNVEQLLQMARQAEQQTRQKLEKAQQPRRKQLDKNW